MDKNLFSLMGISATDDKIREMFDLEPEDNINEALLEQYKTAEIAKRPGDGSAIEQEYRDIGRDINRRLANKGLLAVREDPT